MKRLSTFFLRAKHWHIFLLFIGWGVVDDLTTFLLLSPSDTAPDFRRFALLTAIVTVPYLFCFFTWFWSMGSFLNSLVKPNLRLNASFFVFSLIYPSVYVFVFVFLLMWKAGPNLNPLIFLLILPFHLFTMFCLLYDLYFVAKNLVQAETGRSASFYDYAGPFFLIWFFPIGVWFTQPRINRLYSMRGEATLASGLVTG